MFSILVVVNSVVQSMGVAVGVGVLRTVIVASLTVLMGATGGCGGQREGERTRSPHNCGVLKGLLLLSRVKADAPL